MNLDDLTLGQIKQLTALVDKTESEPDLGPYKIGQAYLIRTVTMYYTGVLVSVGKHELVLEQAAWIPDTGRYHKAVAAGELAEVEPIPGRVIVGRGAIVDAVEWPSGVAVPREVK